MKVDLGIWTKLNRAVISLFVLASLAGIGLWYWPVIQENERLRRSLLETEQELRKEAELAWRLDAALNSLEHPKTVERLARERLGYAKPGEKIIYFEDTTPAEIPDRR
jgi:cell division protein FtsB